MAVRLQLLWGRRAFHGARRDAVFCPVAISGLTRALRDSMAMLCTGMPCCHAPHEPCGDGVTLPNRLRAQPGLDVEPAST
jgi:hypothetical protein